MCSWNCGDFKLEREEKKKVEREKKGKKTLEGKKYGDFFMCARFEAFILFKLLSNSSFHMKCKRMNHLVVI